MDKLVQNKNTYKYMEYIGTLPASPLSRFGSKSCEPLLSVVWSYCAHLACFSFFQLNAGDFVVTLDTDRTLDVSIRKMDVGVVRDYLSCSHYKDALKSTEFHYHRALCVTHMGDEETLLGLDLKKVGGAALTAAGYKTKEDFVKSGQLLTAYDSRLLRINPIWKACGKRELKKRAEYIGAFKQRTFIVEPFCLLYHHKRLFGNQNEAMKGEGWSAYGFNPYDGGVNNLAVQFNRFRRKTMWDGKGWDRVLPHVRDSFNIRADNLRSDPYMQWVIDNNVESFLYLPNGDVIFKTWGNNSGSGSTTVTNILCMHICISHALLRWSHGDSKVFELVYCKLFGDDVVMADNLPMSDTELETLIRSTFSLYGVVLDPYVSSNNLADMEFLGFAFAVDETDNLWFPRYNLPRLCSGLLYSADKMHIDAEVNKAYSLMLMSAGHGEDIYNSFRIVFEQLLVSINTSLAQTFLEVGVPTWLDTMNWFKGLETRFVFSSFSQNIFNDLL